MKEVVEYEVSIPQVSFELDTANTSCDDIKYLCAGISVGDVNHVHNRTSNLELVGCEIFTECEGKFDTHDTQNFDKRAIRPVWNIYHHHRRRPRPRHRRRRRHHHHHHHHHGVDLDKL